jgi:hypothetical protein
MHPDCYTEVATDGVREASRARVPDSPVPGAEELQLETVASADERPGNFMLLAS